jgi:MraZ protein
VFVGTFEHSLDGKGRLVLPAKFRHYLAERAVVTQWEHCLALWTEEGFEDVANRFRERVRNQEIPPASLRAFAATADEVHPDSQGRILLLPRLRTFAGLATKVTLIGSLTHIEIWDKDRYEDQARDGDEAFSTIVSQGGF